MSVENMIDDVVEQNFKPVPEEGATPPAVAEAPPPDTDTGEGELPGGPPDDVLSRIVPEEPVAPDKPAASPETSKLLEEAAAFEEAPGKDNSKANQYWKALKEAAAERDDLAKKIDELVNAKPTDLPEEKVREYEDKIAQYEEKLGQYDIQQTQAFQRDYDMPIRADLTKATRLLIQHAGMEQQAAEQLVSKAIRMPFADRQRLLLDEAPDFANIVSTIMLETDSKIASRAEAIKNHQATRTALQETEVRQSQVQTVKMVEANIAQAIEEAAATGNYYYVQSKSEKDPRTKVWNQTVDEMKTLAKQTMLRAKPDEIARYVVEGLTARKLREDLSAAHAELKKERALRADLRAVKPGMSGRDQAPPPREDGKPKTMDELINDAVALGNFSSRR